MAGEINATQSYIISLFVILEFAQLQVNKQIVIDLRQVYMLGLRARYYFKYNEP